MAKTWDTSPGGEGRGLPVKLIFNPTSGSDRQSPVQLMDIIGEMQKQGLTPEPFLIQPGCDLHGAVEEALQKGTRLFAACGGDGTVSSVARELRGKQARLGIIPTGTRNNVAYSLGVPQGDIPGAIRLLQEGRRVQADMGLAACGGKTMPFLEICSVGLMSALFGASDDIQHGRVGRVGDFLATFVRTPPASIRLTLENGEEVHRLGHVLLVTNMPCVIRRYRVGTPACYRDGMLDLLLFGGLGKLEMMGHALRGDMRVVRADRRIQRLRARRVDVVTDPPMPVMVDGLMLGEGPLHLETDHRALALMAAHGRRGAGTGKEQAG